MKKSSCVALAISIGSLVLAGAAAFATTPSGKCTSQNAPADTCQLDVQSGTKAPDIATSSGVRFDGKVKNVLFVPHPGKIIPVFIDNNGNADLFVPQKTKNEFNDFLQAGYNDSNLNIGLSYAVPQTTYSALPKCNSRAPYSGNTNIAFPTATDSTANTGAIISTYVRDAGSVQNPKPLGTTVTVGSSGTGLPGGSSIEFSFQICSSGVCTNYLEDQVITITAIGTSGTTPWTYSESWDTAGTKTKPVVTTYMWADPIVASGSSSAKYPYYLGSSCTYALDGACGSADTGGQSFPAVPTTNLCSAGYVSSSGVTVSNGKWVWTCMGINSATNASCSANGPAVNGKCAASPNFGCFSISTSNACAAGTLGGWSYNKNCHDDWTCTGSSGGTDANCSADCHMPGDCSRGIGGSGNVGTSNFGTCLFDPHDPSKSVFCCSGSSNSYTSGGCDNKSCGAGETGCK